MHDLEITWPDGQARFSPEDSPVAIGRSPDAAVILTEPSVSRRHIDFVWSGSAWTASDASTHGSFDPIGVRLAPSWTVGTNTTIRLGGVEGVEVRIALLTIRQDAGAELGGPAPPSFETPPPGPPGLDDPLPVGGATPAPPPPPGQGAPSAFDAPPPGERAVLDPPPPGPSPFDPLPPNAPSAPGPAGFEEPPLSGDLGAPPGPAGFDEPPAAPGPGAFDQAPAPPGPSFDESPAPPGPSFEEPPAPPGPSAFDQAPAPPGPSFEEPPAPPGPSFEEPPAPPGLGEQASAEQDLAGFAPPPGPDEWAAPPSAAAPEAPSVFDQPPAAPDPNQGGGVLGGFDQPPGPDSFGQPPVGDPYNQSPPPDEYNPPPQNFDATPPGATGIVPDPASTTAHVSDPSLQLAIDGRDYTFLPGTEITVGRDPSCLVTVDERHSLVSRRHLKISHRDGDWWIEDYSSKGTFIDGRQLTAPYRAEGAFMAQLGDDDAGTPLRVLAAGEHSAPRKQGLGLLIVIGVLAILAIIALFLALRGGGAEGTQTGAGATDTEEATGTTGTSAAVSVLPANMAAEDLAAAKQATVLLIGEQGLGTGFLVTDNLILTNQHVALLGSSLLVAVSRIADDPAIIEYQASTLALHPFLDIAVLEITSDLDGNAVDGSGLSAVSIGVSGSVVLGDDVYSTGFPGNFSVFSSDDMGDTLLPPVGTTSGEAASFAIWPGCSNPDAIALIPQGSPESVGCAPEGDIQRGVVLTTFASGQGASGSPVFRGPDVIAVVFAGPIDEANAGRNITTDSFSVWLDDVITGAS